MSVTEHAVDGVPLQVVTNGGGGVVVLPRHGRDEPQRRYHGLHLLLPHQQLAGPGRRRHDGRRAQGRRVHVLRERRPAAAKIAVDNCRFIKLNDNKSIKQWLYT